MFPIESKFNVLYWVATEINITRWVPTEVDVPRWVGLLKLQLLVALLKTLFFLFPDEDTFQGFQCGQATDLRLLLQLFYSRCGKSTLRAFTTSGGNNWNVLFPVGLVNYTSSVCSWTHSHTLVLKWETLNTCLDIVIIINSLVYFML